MYFAGIDIGSVSTDVIILNREGDIKSYEIIPTGPSFKEASQRGMEGALKKADISRDDIAYVVSTGYGRKNVEFSNKAITEISCHGTGARSVFPGVRTIIDIGGQDCKVISLNDKGNVENFVMNDKCSAGTGRFVDVMARVLDIDLSEMGPLSLKATGKCRISSICTVFAESEVISKLSDDIPREDIIKGIHVSIGERILNLVKRVGLKDPVGITGGGGKNVGIVRILEDLLHTEIMTYENPQIVGALGAALTAKSLHENEHICVSR